MSEITERLQIVLENCFRYRDDAMMHLPPRISADMAIAVLLALREPTESMKIAGAECIDFDERVDDDHELREAGACWLAMIEEAL